MQKTKNHPISITQLKEKVDHDKDGSLDRAKKAIRALNHPMRHKILEILKERGATPVTDIYVAIRGEQSVISQQLKVLRDVGVVSFERFGKEIHYKIEYSRYELIKKLAKEF